MDEIPQTPRLGSCEVCAANPAKYTCPRCEIKSCSLECSKIHKNELECNGIRDRTKFIPINKFTNLDLASDYRLLEEISRTVETAKRNKLHRPPKIGKKNLRLRNEATTRQITLKFLPEHFKKHKSNSSWYNFEKKTIEWRVDWFFVNANLTLTDNRIDETLKLSTILNKYLVKQENSELQEKLQYYQAADLSGIRILLQAERKSGRKFYEIDPTLTLKEALKKKFIIEFPTFHVVLKDLTNSFDIVDSDDESDVKVKTEQKSGNEVVNEIVNKLEWENDTGKPLKNLLFANDISDDDSNEGD